MLTQISSRPFRVLILRDKRLKSFPWERERETEREREKERERQRERDRERQRDTERDTVREITVFFVGWSELSGYHQLHLDLSHSCSLVFTGAHLCLLVLTCFLRMFTRPHHVFTGAYLYSHKFCLSWLVLACVLLMFICVYSCSTCEHSFSPVFTRALTRVLF